MTSFAVFMLQGIMMNATEAKILAKMKAGTFKVDPSTRTVSYFHSSYGRWCHEFGDDGRCVTCGTWRDRGWTSCKPLSPEQARIDWNEIIGVHWRHCGNAAPIATVPPEPRSRPKPTRISPRTSAASPGLWDESENIP